MFGGTPDQTAHFWRMDAEPIPGGHACAADVEKNKIDPFRIMLVEKTTAQLCVNVWWMLLIAATAGTTPSQNSVNAIVVSWVRAFFASCVPPHMVAGSTLFTGIMGTQYCDGAIFPMRLASSRSTLRRPLGGAAIGCACDVETRLAEDVGAAEPRYGLARMLGKPLLSICFRCPRLGPKLTWYGMGQG